MQAVSQAIADVEKMEREEQANRKALLQAKSLSDTKEAHLEADEKKKATEDILEDAKMLIEMPVMVDNSAPEPQTVAEVIEVPAQGSSTSDLDIIIVDSSTLGGQEEVPHATECQVVEVVLDGKNSDRNKQDATSEDTVSVDPQETLKDSGEKDILSNAKKMVVEDEGQDSVGENKDVSVDSCSPEATNMNETVTTEDVIKEEFGMDEGSRIEVVAIEIPTSKTEEKESGKKDKKEGLSKEMEHSTKKDEDEVLMVEEKKQETPPVETTKHDKAPNDGDQKVLKVKYVAMKEVDSSKDSDGQHLVESGETKKEVVLSDVEREETEEGLEGKVQDNASSERDAGGEAADEQCVGEEEGLPTAEPAEGSVKQSKEEVKEETKKQDIVTEDLVTEMYEVTEKTSEATEEEDSHAESSEDEKKVDKAWTDTEHREKAIVEKTRCSNLMFACLIMLYQLHKLFSLLNDGMSMKTEIFVLETVFVVS